MPFQIDMSSLAPSSHIWEARMNVVGAGRELHISGSLLSTSLFSGAFIRLVSSFYYYVPLLLISLYSILPTCCWFRECAQPSYSITLHKPTLSPWVSPSSITSTSLSLNLTLTLDGQVLLRTVRRRVVAPSQYPKPRSWSTDQHWATKVKAFPHLHLLIFSALDPLL